MTGLDMTHITQKTIDLLKIKLAHSGVVVIRGQSIEDSDFVSFLRRIGTLTFTTGETPVAEQPMLNVVTNVGRTTPPRSVFHTDTSYVTAPPKYTALRAIALPKQGGETLFTNQYQAYSTLPKRFKAQLAGRKLLHV
ncbi:MAG: TauD/TfdA family dioxygenase, partial [Cyanobacteria bacterium J06631_2]